ncbi:hypothetical protein DWX00_12800 [Blautia sp. AF17-9LB]|jgi:hypothetical protein|uniref:hypothetical protein n=1 Tax=Blautia sp. AF17-9LB TaxID=2292959 RepID=UPI000E50AC88|nr:hypothetical protein [Blautia sp. AF17-9LB]RHR48649.1 hypothetical protein DWX00_12800 [Blautia sp. AF17-9LB]DAL26295.1 MAG TPA_asm: hypothetical protein [Caudoviricetes sp.]DAZ43615.1 MAG TPA: hypothetical protein [Caudoviricetes sp.]
MLYTKSEIKEQVYEDYIQGTLELDAYYFDFDVCGKKGMLLKAYADIQNTINSDEVVLLHNVSYKEKGGYVEVTGDVDNHDFDEIYNEMYEGNYKDFLESYNGKEKETGLYRLLDSSYKNGKITGTKLHFIL